MQKALSVVAIGLAIAFSTSVYAQIKSDEAVNPIKSEPYEVPKGPVTIYGQTLDPYLEFYNSPDYDGLMWDNVRFLLPEILPDAKTLTLSKENLCDMMVNISLKYSTEVEKTIGILAYEAIDKFPQPIEEPVLMDEVGLRLASRNPEKLNELIKMLPERVDQIMIARDLVMKSKALVILRDAALNNCPDYARQNNYQSYTSDNLAIQ